MSRVEHYLSKVDRGPLLSGAEPFLLKAGPAGCLLLHGWGGTCQSMRYLGDRLQAAGITAFAPLLPGAGTSAADLNRTRAADWVHAAEDHLLALAELCPEVFVVGLSMGAILTLYLGTTHPQVVCGIVPINGGVELDNRDFAAMAFRRDLPDVVPSWDETWLLKDPSAVEVAYREMARTTIVDVMGLAKIVEELLPALTVPVLFLQSVHDRVIPARNGPAMAERAASKDKRVVLLQNSYHVATLDHDRDLVAGEVIDFVRARAAQLSSPLPVGEARG